MKAAFARTGNYWKAKVNGPLEVPAYVRKNLTRTSASYSDNMSKGGSGSIKSRNTLEYANQAVNPSALITARSVRQKDLFKWAKRRKDNIVKQWNAGKI